MKRCPLPLAALALATLSGCATAAPSAPERLVVAELGQTAAVGPSRITPLGVVEDSRCPVGVYCIWAGQVRLSTRIEHGRERTEQILTAGKPVAIAGGTLELHSVTPARKTEAAIPPGDYRFGFRFTASP